MTQQKMWIQSKNLHQQLNTDNNSAQLNNNRTTKYTEQTYNTVNSWTTEYSQQLYTTGRLNTVINCKQRDNWIQSTTVNNRTTEYNQQLYTTEQLNTVNNCTQLDNWIQSTAVHNWKTEYSEQLYTTGFNRGLNPLNKSHKLN